MISSRLAEDKFKKFKHLFQNPSKKPTIQVIKNENRCKTKDQGPRIKTSQFETNCYQDNAANLGVKL